MNLKAAFGQGQQEGVPAPGADDRVDHRGGSQIATVGGVFDIETDGPQHMGERNVGRDPFNR